MKKKEKAPKPLAWSKPATSRCSVAIAELIKVRVKQKLLAKKSALLRDMIVAEGGGKAHGVRASIRHQAAFKGMMMMVNRKASTSVVFLTCK